MNQFKVEKEFCYRPGDEDQGILKIERAFTKICQTLI